MTINITCPKCNFTQRVPEETIPDKMRWVRCPRCNMKFEHISGDDISGEESNSVRNPREPDDAGYFTDLWYVFRSVLFSPTTFFEEKRKADVLKNAIAFGVLLGSIGAMFSIFWQFLMMPDEFVKIINNIPLPLSLNHLFIIFIIVSPLLVVLNIFVRAIILHIFLFILRGANNKFEATLKVSAYANAAEIFSFVPYIGGLIGWVWSIVIIVIGLSEMHEISTLKGLFAVLLPLFLLFLLGMVIAIIFLFSYL